VFAEHAASAGSLLQLCPHLPATQEKNGCISSVPNEQTEPNTKPDSDGTCKVSVAARRSYEVLLPAAAGDQVNCNVMVDKGRVSSGSVSIRLVLRPNNDSREVELLPDHKVSPDDGLYKCSVECSHAGMVAVVFSNTSSVWSRTIHYNADIGMEAQE